MIPLGVELKLNQNRVAIQIYTENWKLNKTIFKYWAPSALQLGIWNQHESYELYELYL